MEIREFAAELALQDKIIAIKRIPLPPAAEMPKTACTLAALNQVLGGKTIVAAVENTTCSGCHNGFGLSDELPNTPGGFGHFLSQGRGPGFPVGERVKASPALAEEMIRRQPQKVGLCSAAEDVVPAVEFAPYGQSSGAELVSILANPDQLATLIHLFCYEKSSYDDVIMPMSSGCASLVRIPLGELARGAAARAVVGNVDVFSRPHFPAESFFFTVPATAFARMLEIAAESVIASPIWQRVRKRIHAPE